MNKLYSVLFLVVIIGYLPGNGQGQDSTSTVAPTPTVDVTDCSSFTNQTTCCDVDGCMFVNCTGTPTCTNDTTTICAEGTDNSNLCSDVIPTSTPVPTANCSAFTDLLSCCGAAENCTFVNCTGTAVCTNVLSVDELCEEDSDKTDLCEGGSDPDNTSSTTPQMTTENPTSPNDTLSTSTPNDTLSTSTSPSSVTDNTTDANNNTVTTETPDINGTTTTEESLSTFTPSVTPTNSGLNDTTTESANDNNGKKCGFDASSFVGGMVLGAVIVGACIIGYKIYQSRSTERYHQF